MAPDTANGRLMFLYEICKNMKGTSAKDQCIPHKRHDNAINLDLRNKTWVSVQGTVDL